MDESPVGQLVGRGAQALNGTFQYTTAHRHKRKMKTFPLAAF